MESDFVFCILKAKFVLMYYCDFEMVLQQAAEILQLFDRN
jgi:hypothetical protein